MNIIKCWQKQGLHSPTNIIEDNDLVCEHLQLTQNGFFFETWSHNELSRLPVLLTRELKGQINYDHKFFWAFCAFLTYNLHEVKLFSDFDWQSSFTNLIHLVLSGRWRRDITGIDNAESFMAKNQAHEVALAKCVNFHLMESASNKWGISAPLAFSVLEGLLKRKNQDFVNIDGTAKTNFEIINNKTGKSIYVEKGRKRLNRIGDSLRCFEQVTLPKQNRTCNYLQDFKTEVCSLYSLPSNSDAYELIDNWRNDLIHGKEYWTQESQYCLT